MIIDLPYPHGFLIHIGKQTAIVSDEPIQEKSLTVVTEDEAFGIANLAAPAQMNIKEFHKKPWQKQHRINQSERRLRWKNANVLYVYPIGKWEPFKETKKCMNGEIVDLPSLTAAEAAVIDYAEDLPKTADLQSRHSYTFLFL